MKLRTFQLQAVADLNAAMAVEGKRDIVLKSPTGSGKTIILTHFMAEYMREHAKTAFVWLTPGEGSLDFAKVLKILDEQLPAEAPVLLEHMTTFEEYERAYNYVAAVAAENGIGI